MPSKPARFTHARKRALNGLAVTWPRCEAVPAVNRPVAAWLKRNFRYAAALAARGLERLALAVASASGSAPAPTAVSRFTRRATIAAPAGFVRESFACKELLLARREGERASAIDAAKGFFCVHLSLLGLSGRPSGRPAFLAGAIAVNDASLRQIVWRKFDLYAVTRENLDVMPAQTAGDMR